MLLSSDSGEQPDLGLAMSKSVRAGGNLRISALSLLDVGYHSGEDFALDVGASEFSGLAEMSQIITSLGFLGQAETPEVQFRGTFRETSSPV
jgi:hypothetical protein